MSNLNISPYHMGGLSFPLLDSIFYPVPHSASIELHWDSSAYSPKSTIAILPGSSPISHVWRIFFTPPLFPTGLIFWEHVGKNVLIYPTEYYFYVIDLFGHCHRLIIKKPQTSMRQVNNSACYVDNTISFTYPLVYGLYIIRLLIGNIPHIYLFYLFNQQYSLGSGW